MGEKLSPDPMSTSQVAGVHPIPLAQERGIDGGKAHPHPGSTSQVAGGYPVSLAHEEGV